MKNKVCILAIDDGPHEKEDLARNHELHLNDPPRTTQLIGAICKGAQLLHVVKSRIQVDGEDATDQILNLFYTNPYTREIRLIMIDSPTLGGFNVPNPVEIFEQTHVPVLLIPDRSPKEKIVEIYSSVFPDRKKQRSWLENLPTLEKLTVTLINDEKITRDIYFHAIGTSKQEIAGLIYSLSEYSGIPEPLRLAHLIASAQILNP